MGLHPSRPCTLETEGKARQSESDLRSLPSRWIFFLDPASLLRLQVAPVRLDQELEQWAWKEICATELSLSSSSRLHPTGSTPGAGSSSSQLRSSSLRCDWRRAFYDLDLSRLNELRATSQDYEFLPSLYGEPACAPEGVSFATRGGRTVDCSLNPRYLGRDRCLLARWPLSAALAATAVAKGPGDAVAYRRVGYYEVTIGNENEHEAVLPCISVGLCSPRFSRYAVARQQAGWDSESWALHSDDGLLFHASNRGYPFDSLSGCATSFGPSDTLGCGIYQAPEEGSAGLEEVAKAPRKIFYTLNGTLLGFAFDLDLPADVPLWPCVGLDTKQWLSFNFGSEPFKFDLDELSPLEVTLKTPFDSLAGAPNRLGASEDMLHALRKYRNWLPRNKRKVAQQMPKTGICQGFTLGLTTDYKVGGQGTPVISKATRAHPGLAEALCRGCRSANPEFHFTSIQVNLNTKYGMHTDGFDAGPSRMIALGNFSKGHLWLHDCRRNHWSLVDVRNTWIAFDGREFHLTEDWEGPERYSLVFFTNHLWDELLPEAQTQLLNLGFHWPRESHVFREELEWPDRRQRSALRSWRRSQLTFRWRRRLAMLSDAFQGLSIWTKGDVEC
ncbi:unnamed protein product [Durusdinium trenchii]|uniref:B30.2/SPRY domain-containing protein n=1 Tax=Durusdinium trenchii TaxID=1381693 RepID=A0ABP0HM70_9DINO